MKMMKPVFKTRVLCTDVPQHAFHEVRLIVAPDGQPPSEDKFECDCGASAIEEGARLGTAVSLGAANVLRRSCAGLVAFLTVGIPQCVKRRADKTGEWGGWKDAWVAYQTNALVQQRFGDLIHERDKDSSETTAAVTKALCSCVRYRDGMTVSDFRQEVCVRDDLDPRVGMSVALFSSDSWQVPIQHGWMENVGRCKPVIDGRFLVGIVKDEPGFVLAIDGTNDTGFVVEKFAVINGKLGKIART